MCGDLFFRIMPTIKHKTALLEDGKINWRTPIKVGSLLSNSSQTVSQLNCLTASLTSRNSELAFLLQIFASSLQIFLPKESRKNLAVELELTKRPVSVLYHLNISFCIQFLRRGSVIL